MKKFLLSVLLLIAMPFLLFSQLSQAVFNRTDCGLNYVMSSVQITNRCSAHAGNTMPASFDISGIPGSCYTIEAAYVWWTVSYFPTSPTGDTVSITNPGGINYVIPALKVDQKGPKCWSETGTRCYRADVKNAITGNGNYMISVRSSRYETDGITLMIIYRDKLASYQGSFVIYDGLLTTPSGADFSQTLSGFSACDNASFAQALSIVSDMQATIGIPWTLTIDGNTTNMQRLFWNASALNTAIVKNQSTVNFSVSPGNTGSDCYSWAMMGIYYQTTTCATCPTGRITVAANPQNQSVCPGNPATITASGGATYSWTSNPPGYTSTNASITVNPMVTTTYTVTGTSADGCFTDTKSVVVNVFQAPTANAGPDRRICLGSSTQIGAPATGGDGNYTYLWNPSTGLSSSNVAAPTANPIVTTTYNVLVTDGNGCTGRDSVTVTVNPLPVVDAGVDRPICIGTTTILGQNASGGTPPYTFLWTPATGLDNPNIQMPNADPVVTTKYYCTITDANGCLDIDSVVVTVYPLPQPVISPPGTTTICSCDSVRLDAGNNGYSFYIWSTGETTRAIIVRNPGQYTVTVTDTNGCFNTSSPVTVNVIYPSSVIALSDNTFRAAPGEKLSIPLFIRSSKNLDTCNVRDFHAVITYNKTLLVPIGSTPQGLLSGPNRVLDFTGTRGASDTLILLSFEATLGNSPETPLNLSQFEWTDCPIPDSIIVFNGDFVLNNLCTEGGITRLYNYEGVPASLRFMPNPVEDKGTIDFSLAESGRTKLALYDILGKIIKTFYDSDIGKGAYSLEFETDEIPSGIYLLTLKTPTQVITRIMEVRK